MGSVIRAHQLCHGGSFNLARGLMETFIAAGGALQPQVDIAGIIVENNKATGIELTDAQSGRGRSRRPVPWASA